MDLLQITILYQVSNLCDNVLLIIIRIDKYVKYTCIFTIINMYKNTLDTQIFLTCGNLTHDLRRRSQDHYQRHNLTQKITYKS